MVAAHVGGASCPGSHGDRLPTGAQATGAGDDPSIFRSSRSRRPLGSGPGVVGGGGGAGAGIGQGDLRRKCRRNPISDRRSPAGGESEHLLSIGNMGEARAAVDSRPTLGTVGHGSRNLGGTSLVTGKGSVSGSRPCSELRSRTRIERRAPEASAPRIGRPPACGSLTAACIDRAG